jgi:hypothetical protein
MAIDSKPLPSKEDAIEFVKLVDSSKSKTNALREDLLLDCDEEVRNKVTNHSTYEWIHSHRKFHKVIQRLRDKGLTGEYPPQLEIEIAYCIAPILHMYIIFKSHPESIRRTTEACATKALKHVNGLQLLLDTELQMENFMDSVELRILLDKLNLELSGGGNDNLHEIAPGRCTRTETSCRVLPVNHKGSW